MSVYALKPNFTDRETYKEWRKSWKTVYSFLSNDIRRRKHALKEQQRAGEDTAKLQREFRLQRADAHKMMTLLSEAKARRDRISDMKRQIAEQNASFPLTVESRVVDVHYNRVHNEFPWMPMWTVKASGRSYYVNHIDAQMGFSTRELESGSTRGMLRFRNVELTFTSDGTAVLVEKNKVKLAA